MPISPNGLPLGETVSSIDSESRTETALHPTHTRMQMLGLAAAEESHLRSVESFTPPASSDQSVIGTVLGRSLPPLVLTFLVAVTSIALLAAVVSPPKPGARSHAAVGPIWDDAAASDGSVHSAAGLDVWLQRCSPRDAPLLDTPSFQEGRWCWNYGEPLSSGVATGNDRNSTVCDTEQDLVQIASGLSTSAVEDAKVREALVARRLAVLAAASQQGSDACESAAPMRGVWAGGVALAGLAVWAAVMALWLVSIHERKAVQAFCDNALVLVANVDDVVAPSVVRDVHVSQSAVSLFSTSRTSGAAYVKGGWTGDESEHGTSPGMTDSPAAGAPEHESPVSGNVELDVLMRQMARIPHQLAEIHALAKRSVAVKVHGPQPMLTKTVSGLTGDASDHASTHMSSQVASPAGSPTKIGGSAGRGMIVEPVLLPPPVRTGAFGDVGLYRSASDDIDAPMNFADQTQPPETTVDDDNDTVSEIAFAPWSRSMAPGVSRMPPQSPQLLQSPDALPTILVDDPKSARGAPGELPGPPDAAQAATSSYLTAFTAWADNNTMSDHSRSTSRSTSRRGSQSVMDMHVPRGNDDETEESVHRVSRLSAALKTVNTIRSAQPSRRSSFMSSYAGTPPAANNHFAAPAEPPGFYVGIPEQNNTANTPSSSVHTVSASPGMAESVLNDNSALMERFHDVMTFDLRRRPAAIMHCAVSGLFAGRKLTGAMLRAREYFSQLFLAAVTHVAKAYSGDISRITADSITVTWNAVSPFPFPEARATRCAVDVANNLEQLIVDLMEGTDPAAMADDEGWFDTSARPWQRLFAESLPEWARQLTFHQRREVGETFSDQWAVGVSSGPLLIGLSGTENMCAMSFVGATVTHVEKLTQLAICIKCQVVLDETCVEAARSHSEVVPIDVTMSRSATKMIFGLRALRNARASQSDDVTRRATVLITSGVTQLASTNYPAAISVLSQAVDLLRTALASTHARSTSLRRGSMSLSLNNDSEAFGWLLAHARRLQCTAAHYANLRQQHESAKMAAAAADGGKVNPFSDYARKPPGWLLIEQRANRFVDDLNEAGISLRDELPTAVNITGETPAPTESSWASTPASGILLPSGKTPATGLLTGKTSNLMSPQVDLLTKQLRGQLLTKSGTFTRQANVIAITADDVDQSDSLSGRTSPQTAAETALESPTPGDPSRSSRSRSVASIQSAASAESENGSETDSPRAPGNAYRDARGQKWRRSQKELGAGAFGTVYLGLRGNGELVAMKCIKLPEDPSKLAASIGGRRLSELSNDSAVSSLASKSATGDAGFESLLKEIHTLSSVRHQNIVAYLSSLLTPSEAVIVMEYVPGGSVTQLVQRFGPPPMATMRGYMLHILHGLAALHRRGIVHCDLSTSNVLVASDGVVKLADFGCSKSLGNIVAGTSVGGTPAFMAPEAARGQPEKASDVWSVGVIVLFLLSGQVPYPEDLVAEPRSLIDKLSAMDRIDDAPLAPTLDVNTHVCSALQQKRPDSIAMSSPMYGTDAATALRYAASDRSHVASPLQQLGSDGTLPHDVLLAVELAESCLVLDPAKRPTAEQLLRHGMFT